MVRINSVNYSLFNIIFGTIASLLLAIFMTLIPLIKGLLFGLFDIILFSLILWWLSPLKFYYSLGIILLFRAVLVIIFDLKLLRQTVKTQFLSTIDSKRLWPFFAKYIKKGERTYASPKLMINGSSYIVIEFGTYLNPSNEDKITGFLILDYNTGIIIKEESVLTNVMSVYGCWRYIYFKPILGKFIKTKRISLIKSWIKFQNRFKKIIQKRRNDGYKEVSKVKDANFVQILKDLDEEVINQYPFIINKLKKKIKILNELYDIFSKPGYNFYQEFINDINYIAKMGSEENKIWTHRLRTWDSLYKYQKLKIKNLPAPNFKIIKFGLIGDIINAVVLKQQRYPIGGATITLIGVEGSKKIKKDIAKFLNEYVTYHLCGIGAIKKNIELNNDLKEVSKKYNQIWGQADTSKIRNPKNEN